MSTHEIKPLGTTSGDPANSGTPQRGVKIHNYKSVNSANPGFGPQRTMTYGELAAFIAMCFWMDNANAPAKPYGAFFPDGSGSDQVSAILAALNDHTLTNDNLLFAKWGDRMGLNGTPADAGFVQGLADVHSAISDFLTNMPDWDVCSSVGLDMVKAIANLK